MGSKSQYEDAFRSHFLGPKQPNELQLHSSRTVHNHLKLGKEDYNFPCQTVQEIDQSQRRCHRRNKQYQPDKEEVYQYNQHEQCSQMLSSSYTKQGSLHVERVSKKQQQNLTESNGGGDGGYGVIYKNPKFLSLNAGCKDEGSSLDNFGPRSIDFHESNLKNKSVSSPQHKSLTPLFPDFTTSIMDKNIDPDHSAFSKTSTGSNISGRTVVSLKSVADLRETIRSQIAMTNMFDESFRAFGGKDKTKTRKEGSRSSGCKTVPKVVSATVSQVSSPKLEPIDSQNQFSFEDKLSFKYSTRSQQDNDLCESVQTQINHSPVIAADTNATCENINRSGNFILSVDDLVNSKIINPMIRKLQRMYLNTLREEMSLMEDLENLPQMVSEVYRSTAATKKL